MTRGIEHFDRHTQMTGEKLREIERLLHGKGSGGRSPCVCDMCSAEAVSITIARSGVMLACPDCARIELGNIRIQIIVQGERNERQACFA